MKRVVGVLLVLLGSAALGLGLLFLVGAAGELRRYVVAAVGLLLGVGLSALGVRLYRTGALSSPDRIEGEILAVAKRRSGEVSEADLRAALGARWPLAGEVLESMARRGLCKASSSPDGARYVFAGLLPRLVTRRCDFCEAELPLDEELATCPRCGGTFRTAVEKVSLDEDELYGMDE